MTNNLKCFEIDAQCLFNAFLSGNNEVIKNKNALDRINVFPVADGDTGTNLILTLNSVQHSKIQNTAGETLAAMADAALSGARGNSGIIFAEFIGGLSENLRKIEKISAHDLAEGAKNAVHRAYNAISEPVEGTILTVLKDWAHAVEKNKTLKDFTRILPETLQTAKVSLENTPNQLKILKESHVLDAGAEGFFLFMKGFTNYFTSGCKKIVEAKEGIDIVIPEHTHDIEAPLYRYCTEAFIDNNTRSSNEIKGSLKAFGDSLIVAGNEKKARIHIHSDQPAEVFRILSEHSNIIEQKVDDMVREYQVTQERKYSIALLTDSVCDLPQEIFDKYQIHVIPMNINFEGNQYLDGITIQSDYIFNNIDRIRDFPKSSQPSPKTFRLMYSYLSTYYDSIIAVHVSSKLSNTFKLSKAEADKLKDKKISVIDSLQNSGAQGLVVLRAAEDIAAGKSHEEVVKNIEKNRLKSKILVKLPTLKYMVRGGRISPFKGLIAKFINLKPIVSLDENGESVIPGKSLSSKRTHNMILEMVKKEMEKGKLKYYAIVYGMPHEEVDIFEEELKKITGVRPLFKKPISPIIGLHAGPQTFAVVTMRE